MAAGDRVATLQVNCPELVETVFATAKLDALYVPLNFRAKADELTAMLNNAEPTVLLVGQRYVDLVESDSAVGERPAARGRRWSRPTAAGPSTTTCWP